MRDRPPFGPAHLLVVGLLALSVTSVELFAEGPNNRLLKILGKNEKSQGQGLDLVNIICERIQ